MATISNNTKVILFPESILDGHPVYRSKCIVVEHYDFSLGRNLNCLGEPFGCSENNSVKIKIRVGSRDNLKLFYERMNQDYPSSYTLLYNVKYDDNHLVGDNYDSGMVLSGIISDLQEEYLQHRAGSSETGFTLTITILLTSLTCLGSSRNLQFDLHN